MKIGKITPKLNTNFQYDTWVKHDEVDLAMPTETPTGPLADFGSAYFDRPSTAYLSIPDSTDWDIMGDNTENITIDFWVKHTDVTNTQYYISQKESTTEKWYFILEANRVNFYARNAGGALLDMPSPAIATLEIGRWYHLALIKVGTAFGTYIDGDQVSYGTTSSEDTWASPLHIGLYDTSPFGAMNGSMSEVRYQKSNDFSATPVVGLTDTITVPTTPHTSDSNTKLLLHFDGDFTDSGNTGHAVVPDAVVLNWTETKLLMHGEKIADASGTAKQITAVGTAMSSGGKFGTQCGKWNGSTSQIEIPDSADWDLGSGDFTLDYWIKYKSQEANNYWMIGRKNSSNWYMQLSGGNNPSGTLYFEGTHFTATNLGTWAPVVGQWYHMAIVRNGTELACYIDGVQTGTYNCGTTAIVDTAQPLMVGSHVVTYGASTNCDMEEVRISKGIARWTENFDVPTEPYTSDANTVLLLHLDGDNTDSGNTGHTPVDTAMTYSPAPAVGTGMLYFDGNSDYFSTPNVTGDFDVFGNLIDDWTVECWVNKSMQATTGYACSHQTDTSNTWGIYVNGSDSGASAGFPGVFFRTGGVTRFGISGTTDVADDAWHHIAFIKRGGAVGLFIDGTQEAGTITTYTLSPTTSFIVGQRSSSIWYGGYIEDFRITKGNPYSVDVITAPYAHYKCNDDAVNTVVTDDGTGSNNGTASANTSTLSSTGKINESFLLDGTTPDYISIPGLLTDIKADETGSFSCWFYVDGSGNQCLFSLGDVSAAGTYFAIRTTNGNINVNVRKGGTFSQQLVTANTVISQTTWHHLVVTQDGVSGKIYVDGQNTAWTNIYSGDGDWIADADDGNFDVCYIGKQVYSGSVNFNGNIDDVRYYQGVALSASQVAQIYNSGTGTEGLGDDITIPTATLTGDDPIASYTFSGLDGNTDETYKIVGNVIHAKTGSSNTEVLFNGDTGSNYYYQQFLAYGTTESAGRGTRAAAVIGYTGQPNYFTSTVTLINAKSGKVRLVDAQWLGDATGTTIGYIGKESCVWNNSDDNITTITVDPDGEIGTGSQITLYKKVTR